MLFSDHNGRFVRQQPGAMTIGHSPKGQETSYTQGPQWYRLCIHVWQLQSGCCLSSYSCYYWVWLVNQQPLHCFAVCRCGSNSQSIFQIQISSYHARHLMINRQADLLQWALHKLHIVAEWRCSMVHTQCIQQPNLQHWSPQYTFDMLWLTATHHSHHGDNQPVIESFCMPL